MKRTQLTITTERVDDILVLLMYLKAVYATEKVLTAMYRDQEGRKLRLTTERYERMVI